MKIYVGKSGNRKRSNFQVIPLCSAWVMTAVFAPSGNLVGCGGMDNMLTVYDINNRDASGGAKLLREFLGYEGFLSSCRFLDDSNVVTGEFSSCLDLERKKHRSLIPPYFVLQAPAT